MLNKRTRKRDFPSLEGQAYLNTAAEGVPPLAVGAALQQYFEDKQLGMDGRKPHAAQWDAAPLDHEGPFHAQLAAVDRAAPGALAAAGGLGDAPVDGNVGQGQADDAIVGFPGDLFQVGEDPGPDPLVAAVPDRGGPAGAVGDRGIRAAEPQDLEELFEDDPVGDPRFVAAQRVRGVIDGPVGQQRGELVPQRVQQP